MVDFAEKTVTCPHPDGKHNVVYSVFEGDPAKTVLCVHGLSRNGQDFHWLAASLQKDGYRVLCPDMPGRARSPNLANPAHYNYPQYLSDITHLLAQEKVGRVDWMGTSMGGLLGMMAAAVPESVVKNLVINDIGPYIPASALQFIQDYVSKNPAYLDHAQFRADFRNTRKSFGLQTEEEWAEFERISTVINPDGTIQLNYDTNITGAMTPDAEVKDLDFWPVWNAFKQQVLILRGADSNVLSAETMNKMLIGKQATGVTFPNVGHAPALMNAQQIGTIKDWLNAR